MEFAQSKAYWHSNDRNIISFCISVVILFFLLSIPLKQSKNVVNLDRNLIIFRVKNIQKIIEKETINFKKNKIQIIERHLINATPPLKDIIKRTNKTVVTRSKSKSKETLPSSTILYSSRTNTKKLEIMGADFQVRNNNFIAKEIVKSTKQLIVVDQNMLNIKTMITESFSTSVLKKAVGFLSAIDEPEKTIDSLPYCFNLGRHSPYCL